MRSQSEHTSLDEPPRVEPKSSRCARFESSAAVGKDPEPRTSFVTAHGKFHTWHTSQQHIHAVKDCGYS